MATQLSYNNRSRNFVPFKRSREEDGYSHYSNQAKRGKFYNSEYQKYQPGRFHNSEYQKYQPKFNNNRTSFKNQQLNRKFQSEKVQNQRVNFSAAAPVQTWNVNTKWVEQQQQQMNRQFECDKFRNQRVNFSAPAPVQTWSVNTKSVQQQMNRKFQNEKVQNQRVDFSVPPPVQTWSVNTKSVEEVVKLLLDNETATRPSSTLKQPIRKVLPREPLRHEKASCSKQTAQKTSCQTVQKKSLDDDDYIDVQEEWRKYKAANPPLGGFSVKNVPSKEKR